MTKYLGLHETLETLEIMAFQSVAATKALTMSKVLADGDLKDILAGHYDSGTQGLKRLRTYITNREEEQNV